jgi:hypothetical protein
LGLASQEVNASIYLLQIKEDFYDYALSISTLLEFTQCQPLLPETGKLSTTG